MVRPLPHFTVSKLWEVSRGRGMPSHSLCWTKARMYRAWRALGSPRTFTAEDVLVNAARLGLDEALRAACHMLPVGFMGFPSGERARISYLTRAGSYPQALRDLQADLARWRNT